MLIKIIFGFLLLLSAFFLNKVDLGKHFSAFYIFIFGIGILSISGTFSYLKNQIIKEVSIVKDFKKSIIIFLFLEFIFIILLRIGKLDFLFEQFEKGSIATIMLIPLILLFNLSSKTVFISIAILFFFAALFNLYNTTQTVLALTNAAFIFLPFAIFLKLKEI